MVHKAYLDAIIEIRSHITGAIETPMDNGNGSHGVYWEDHRLLGNTAYRTASN